jgi:hypothetical protein
MFFETNLLSARRFLFGGVLLVVSMLYFLQSCDDRIDPVIEDLDASINFRMSNEDLVDSTGIYHNLGLEELRIYYYDDHFGDSLYMDDALVVINSYFKSEFSWDALKFDQDMLDSMQKWSYNGDTDAWNDFANDGFNNISDSLSTQEFDMVKDMLDKTSEMSDIEFYDFCDSMQTAFNAKTWDKTYQDGDLIGGAIAIGKKSYEYWTGQGAPSPTSGTLRLPQIDMIAYIAIWVDLYIEECIDCTGCDSWETCPGQHSRIQRAARGALLASAGAGFLRIGGIF